MEQNCTEYRGASGLVPAIVAIVSQSPCFILRKKRIQLKVNGLFFMNHVNGYIGSEPPRCHSPKQSLQPFTCFISLFYL